MVMNVMYGPEIKKIRVAKSLSLKSVYVGVCSKTNAIKFEKGDRTLAADKFHQVLSNLMITMDEFLWINNDFKPTLGDYRQYQLKETWNSDQLTDFEVLIHQVEGEKNQIERVKLASYRLLSHYKAQKKSAKGDLDLVIDYFSNLSAWTLEDVRFFANNCYVLPYDQMLNLLTEVLKVLQRYRYYPQSKAIFATAFLNCVDRMIRHADFSKSLVIIEQLKLLTSEVTMAGYRLLVMYYEAKIQYLRKDKASGKVALLKVLKTAQFLGATQIVTEIDKLLK